MYSDHRGQEDTNNLLKIKYHYPTYVRVDTIALIRSEWFHLKPG